MRTMRTVKAKTWIIRKVHCPKCSIIAGKRCMDMRKPEGRTRYIKGMHRERWMAAFTWMF